MKRKQDIQWVYLFLYVNNMMIRFIKSSTSRWWSYVAPGKLFSREKMKEKNEKLFAFYYLS